jgi:hypothetical protein
VYISFTVIFSQNYYEVLSCKTCAKQVSNVIQFPVKTMNLLNLYQIQVTLIDRTPNMNKLFQAGHKRMVPET